MIGVVVATGGVAALTAYTIGTRAVTISTVPVRGIREATQSIIGQNIGTMKPDRARRTVRIGIEVAGVYVLGLAVVLWFAPGRVVALVAPNASESAAELAFSFLRILAVNVPAIGALYLFQAAFVGAGRTRTNLAASLLEQWGVRLPIALGIGIGLGYGVIAVFWSVALSTIAVAIGLGLYYRYEIDRGMLTRAVERVDDTESRRT